MLCLKILFLIVMIYAGVCDWKDRIVYIKTWIAASILSFAIAYLEHYTVHQVIFYSRWLLIILIVMDIFSTAVYKIKDRKFVFSRNLKAEEAVNFAFANKTCVQKNIDTARGFVFSSSLIKRKKLDSMLNKMQHELNKSTTTDALIEKACKKIACAEISNTAEDLYTANSFFRCIGNNVHEEYKVKMKKLSKRIKVLPDKVTNEIFYGIGWGDIAISPAVTLFCGSIGLTIIIISLLLSLLCIKFSKKNDETIPLVTYMAVGCIIAFFKMI